MQRTGQSAGNSAILIIIITAVIVLYILFLPPQERADLLGESTGSGSGGSTGGGSGGNSILRGTATLLHENIGRISYVSTKEQEHAVPSILIRTTQAGSVIKNVDSVYVKSSTFDSIIQNVSFELDTEITKEVKLSFNTGDRADGRLIILLNGERILNDEIAARSSKYIDLPQDKLSRYNTLTVGTSTPGWAFWSMNEYQLLNVQIIGTIKDLSGSESTQKFYISEDEMTNLDRAIVKYYVDCTPDNVGPLTIKVNGRTVSQGIADCGVINPIELDKWVLDAGENEIEFSTTRGSYLVTNIVVKTLLKEPDYPIYYFDIDEDFFTSVGSNEDICGKVDGLCPSSCEADEDKDCCFEESEDFYWCDAETSQSNDRCVSFVTETTCSRCISGYEDDSGNPAETCEDICGDDTDDFCPLGCSSDFDMDCCFAAGENYWCDDVPLGRSLSSVCKGGVEPDEKAWCPERYFNEDGRRLNYVEEDTDDDEEKLKSNYEVLMYFTFPNSDLKSAVLLLNGREIGLNTRSVAWDKDISSYVQSQTNSLQIIPEREMDVTSLDIKIRPQ